MKFFDPLPATPWVSCLIWNAPYSYRSIGGTKAFQSMTKALGGDCYFFLSINRHTLVAKLLPTTLQGSEKLKRVLSYYWKNCLGNDSLIGGVNTEEYLNHSNFLLPNWKGYYCSKLLMRLSKDYQTWSGNQVMSLMNR